MRQGPHWPKSELRRTKPGVAVLWSQVEALHIFVPLPPGVPTPQTDLQQTRGTQV